MLKNISASSRMSIFCNTTGLQVLDVTYILSLNSWMSVGSVTQKEVIQIEVSFCATPLVAPNGTAH